MVSTPWPHACMQGNTTACDIKICNGSLKTSVSDKLEMTKEEPKACMNVVLTVLVVEPCVQVHAW